MRYFSLIAIFILGVFAYINPPIEKSGLDSTRILDARPSGNKIVVAYYSDVVIPTFNGEDTKLRTYNSWTKIINEKKKDSGIEQTRQTTFFSKGEFVKISNGEWRQIAYKTVDSLPRETLGHILFQKVLGNLAFADTFYPDSGDPGTNSVDGYVSQQYGNGSNISWATIRGLTDGTNVSSTGAQINAWYFSSDLNCASSNYWRYLFRSFFLFDTSALPDTSTITAATFSLVGASKADPMGNAPDTNIYAATPASDTTISTADYDQVGSTAYATAVPYPSLTSDSLTYTDFTFNTTGKAAVSKTGISRFSVRDASYDASGTNPFCNGNYQDTLWTVIAADTAGTATDPKLVVTYTTITTQSGTKALIGIGF